MSATFIDYHLFNIITCDILIKKYSKHAKTATLRTVFKKYGRTKTTCKSLNMFSKIYQRFLHENIMNYVAVFLSKFISAYRKSFSTNHVLIILIENWKKPLEMKKFVGTVSMDLSKVFDSIPHDFLIGKMYAYRFSINTVVTFFYS